MARPEIHVELLQSSMQYGDILLLCTDGLSDYISHLDMEEILEMPKSLPQRLKLLTEKALEKGCSDNISIIAIVYYDEKRK